MGNNRNYDNRSQYPNNQKNRDNRDNRQNQKKAVYSIIEREGQEKAYWLRLGTAFVNRDGSLTVYLNALPTNAKLHIRDVPQDNDNRQDNNEIPF